MSKIKICGLRRVEDIEYVNEFLPDYAGFVFAKKSKRYVTPEQAKELISKLDKRIKSAGIFVNTPIEEVNQIASLCGLYVVQLHGDETPEECRKAKIKVWKALSVKGKEIEDELKKFKDSVELFVLDNGPGGTGEKFDWEIVKGLSAKYKIFLAGGITPENAKEAESEVKPYGIDVSSGVETDGVKDRDKIAKLIENLRK